MSHNITDKLNRCTECGKILRPCNKSKMCFHHYSRKVRKSKRSIKLRRKYQRKYKIKNRTKFCGRCGMPCSGKLLIEVRKGIYYGFCPSCFEKLRTCDLKYIKKVISNKSLSLNNEQQSLNTN